jgi:hypothetical protein
LYFGVIYLKLEWRLTFISKLVLFFLRPKWKLALLKRWAWFIWNLNRDLFFLHLYKKWFWFILSLNGRVHSQLGYHNKNHDTHLSFILNSNARTWQNECFEMLNNERGVCMFKLSTNKCYNEWFKSIKQILNVLFKYKPQRNVGLLWDSKMTYFHLKCQNPIKNIK